MRGISPEPKDIKKTLKHPFVERRLIKHPLCARSIPCPGHRAIKVSASIFPLDIYIPDEGERQYSREVMNQVITGSGEAKRKLKCGVEKSEGVL